jgi:hypothetical protein
MFFITLLVCWILSIADRKDITSGFIISFSTLSGWSSVAVCIPFLVPILTWCWQSTDYTWQGVSKIYQALRKLEQLQISQKEKWYHLSKPTSIQHGTRWLTIRATIGRQSLGFQFFICPRPWGQLWILVEFVKVCPNFSYHGKIFEGAIMYRLDGLFHSWYISRVFRGRSCSSVSIIYFLEITLWPSKLIS